MESGKLRDEIELQRATFAADAAGTQVATWTTLADVWARIKPLRGRESVEQMQIQSDVTHEIQIRFFEGLKSEDRIKFGSRIFNFMAPPINVNERSFEHLLMCKEAV